jgi:hypothetical protein
LATSLGGGETPSWLATKYNGLVVQRLTSINDPITQTQRWFLVGDTHESPAMVSIPSEDGRNIRFDLSFQLADNHVGKTRTLLLVETAGSYDLNYVDTHFKEFLKKVRLSAQHIKSSKGIKHCFAYIAPFIPSAALDPRIFQETARVGQLFVSLGLDLDVETADLLRGRIMTVMVAIEHSVLCGEGE